MPDVFVAPDENKDSVVMHKRSPLPSPPTVILETKKNDSSPTSVIEKQPTRKFVQEEQKKVDISTPKKNDPIVMPQEEQITFNPTIDLSIGSEERRNAIPLFASFWQNPHGVYFDTQEANEHILLFLRRHFITNVPWIFYTFLLACLPPIVSYIFTRIDYPFTFLPATFIAAIVGMYYLVLATSSYLHFLDWYYNISLITPKRVLDIELKDLVYKKISATKISLVQDINYTQTGTIRTLFNYGEVLIQTAGTQDNFYINSVPKPEVVVRIVEELIGKGREDKDNASL